MMTPTVLHRDELPHDGNAYEFQGQMHGDVGLSFIWVDMPPGEGPRLHTHPYEEVFLIQEGSAIFTIGATSFQATAGQIAIVPAGVPHKFVSAGPGPLRQIDIHRSPHFITEWLES